MLNDCNLRLYLEYYFTSIPGNLHKWVFANRGCAVLWTSPKYHDVIRPLVTSGWLDHSLMMDFIWQGTVDHTNYFSSGAGGDFINKEIGGQVNHLVFIY